MSSLPVFTPSTSYPECRRYIYCTINGECMHTQTTGACEYNLYSGVRHGGAVVDLDPMVGRRTNHEASDRNRVTKTSNIHTVQLLSTSDRRTMPNITTQPVRYIHVHSLHLVIDIGSVEGYGTLNLIFLIGRPT
jgi:hypothetical protein